MRSIRIAGIAAVGLLISTAVWAQTGSISGVVTDTSGAVLPGVTVEAASPALIEQSRSAISDSKGFYNIVALRTGTYSVTFSLAGFRPTKRENIELTTGFTATVNASLPLGSLQESVTVTGEAPIVDTVNSRVQTVVSKELIESLPVAKNAGAFAQLIPGATGTQDVGGSSGENGQAFAIHGGSSGDFQQFRDGMNSNSLLASGNILSSENPSMMQEIVVETGGFDPSAQTGGGHINLVTKDGGNTFNGTVRFDQSTGGMQSNNLNDAVRARGATTPGKIRDRHDYNGAFGGPLLQDKLWFMVGLRTWRTSQYQVNNYYNATQGTLFYTPDLSRPAYSLDSFDTSDVRLTYQATPKNKFTVMVSPEHNCSCFFGLNGNISPEAAGSHHLWPEYRIQTTWTNPITSNLLLWAGGTYQYTDLERFPEGTGTTADRSVLELSTNYRYGAPGSQLSTPGGSFGNQKSKQINENATVTWIKGQHSVSSGIEFMQGIQTKVSTIADSISYSLRKDATGTPIPSSVTLFATPFNWAQRVDYYAAFVGDQWKLGRATLNLGARYDGEVGSVPAQHLAAGPYVPERNFAAKNDIPHFHDIDPRLGIAYDLFGTGKTAIKGSLSRNLAFDPPGGIVQQNNPVFAMVITANRNWTDANHDYVPQESELGALSNTAFGTVVSNTTWSNDVLKGWYKRPYNWSSSVSVQQQILSSLSVNVGYFRTWYGNFTVTDNVLVTPADYDAYSIPAPIDPRLPGGGGYMVSGLYDVKVANFNTIQNVVVPASNFGTRTQVFNGIDVTMNYRHRGYFLSGGLSSGATATDTCDLIVDSPQTLNCHTAPPWSAGTQLKFQGVVPLPLAFQLSGNYQMLPSINQLANYSATNAVVKPALGRNLSAGSNATVSIPLIAPGTVYAEGWNQQFDLRVSRRFKYGRFSAQPTLDLYNIFNAASVLATNNTYSSTTANGGSWNQVTSLLGARTVKLGVQVSF
jgi:hypothetical protein